MSSLLDEPFLVVDQVTSFFSNDFSLYDASGEVVGTIATLGSAASRLVLGNRHFEVLDADGTVVMRLRNVFNLGRDTFELEDDQGASLGRVRKELTFFKTRLTAQSASGEEIDLNGSWFDFDFTVNSAAGPLAQVHRTAAGVGAWLLGRQRYLVSFASSASPTERRLALGCVIAVDLIRQKGQQAAASS